MAGCEWTYDVFLSFRGKDTRMGFTGNLYNALDQKGIRTFIDDEELQSGEQITPALHKAIEESRIAIIVLSKNYAFSSFCLDELATILKCLEGKDQLVLPVFYDVDPADVRHQRGGYGEALARHEERFKDNREKVHRWRMALYRVANLSGFHFKQGDEYEYKFIGRIVKQVSNKINRAPLHVANYLVGLESRVLKVNSLLDVESNVRVQVVGIHGIGGIGKTTIARVVYNLISDQFEGVCFLEDVRVNSIKYGLVYLQELFLFEIVGDDINLGNVNKGISVIKQRLHRKKVLLILDDVDKVEQLEAIVGKPCWFGSGSRLIITTRNKYLLLFYGIERTYEVEELNDEEARELLSWNAFKTKQVDPSYEDILKRAVTYASGLPLALEVIGSNLCGKGKEEWKSALDRYEKIPDRQIQNVLKVSYDSLHEDEQKVFLDISCCFRGYKLSDVEDILCAHHGLSMKFSIGQLIEKSLIKIDDEGLVTLHDMIQHMGREIVRQESQEDPGKRSRLWFFKDVVQVLEDNTGTNKIQILILDFPKDEVHSKRHKGEKVDWDGEAFKKMKKLRTLIIRNGYFSKVPMHLPNSLRVLKWWGYPSPSLPFDFQPKKLAILKLHYSCLKQSEPIQSFVCLTVLDVGYSEHITNIPDVSSVPNLEKLSFKGCENLTEIHRSVGFLDKLRILDGTNCKKLKTFPPIKLASLEQLNLSNCSILENFPEILGKMENMIKLHIMGSPIKELPFSIHNLTRLRELELQLCGMVQLPSSIVMLQELNLIQVSKCEALSLSNPDEGEEMMCSNAEHLILSCCKISDDFPSTYLAWFANVKYLNLSGNNFTTLHASIKECHFLKNLKLDDCMCLREIKGIPSKLETFSAKGCTSLKGLDLTVLPACTEECQFLAELILDDCAFLREIRGISPKVHHFSAKNCTSLTSRSTSILLNQELHKAGNKTFSLPGTGIPPWFDHRTREWSISFWFRSSFPAISLCLVIGLVNEQPIMAKFSPRVFINGNMFPANRKVYEFQIATDHIFLFDLQLITSEDNNVDMVLSDNEWNYVEVSYVDHMTNSGVPIKRAAKQSGIYVLKQTSSMKDIRFTNPNYKRESDDNRPKELTNAPSAQAKTFDSSVFNTPHAAPASNKIDSMNQDASLDDGEQEEEAEEPLSRTSKSSTSKNQSHRPPVTCNGKQAVAPSTEPVTMMPALKSNGAKTIVLDGSDEARSTPQQVVTITPRTSIVPLVAKDQSPQPTTDEARSTSQQVATTTPRATIVPPAVKDQSSQPTADEGRLTPQQAATATPQTTIVPSAVKDQSSQSIVDEIGSIPQQVVIATPQITIVPLAVKDQPSQLIADEAGSTLQQAATTTPRATIVPSAVKDRSSQPTADEAGPTPQAATTAIAWTTVVPLAIKDQSSQPILNEGRLTSQQAATTTPQKTIVPSAVQDQSSHITADEAGLSTQQAAITAPQKVVAPLANQSSQPTAPPGALLLRQTQPEARESLAFPQRRKKMLETKIASIIHQLAKEESNLERHMPDMKNQEATLSTHSVASASLDKQAQALPKKVEYLVVPDEVKDESEAARLKRIWLKSTWYNMTNEFMEKIKNSNNARVRKEIVLVSEGTCPPFQFLRMPAPDPCLRPCRKARTRKLF